LTLATWRYERIPGAEGGCHPFPKSEPHGSRMLGMSIGSMPERRQPVRCSVCTKSSTPDAQTYCSSMCKAHGANGQPWMGAGTGAEQGRQPGWAAEHPGEPIQSEMGMRGSRADDAHGSTPCFAPHACTARGDEQVKPGGANVKRDHHGTVSSNMWSG
jgi:hypothetical protein